MVVNDFDVFCVAFFPYKAEAILVVDAKAMLSLAIANESLKPISARDRKIGETGCPMKNSELLQG
jgi:hypothetical protein